jgi:hypothetical protein
MWSDTTISLKKPVPLILIAVVFLTEGTSHHGIAQTAHDWKVHDQDRPRPTVVDPGSLSIQQHAGQHPSDAIILFDGRDFSEWSTEKGEPVKWKLEKDYMEVVKKTGTIMTRQGFGDCQLHIEWATPSTIKGEGQGRGNSGVFLMGLYEIQVLDSYQNDTYADGQAAAVYGQYPPLVNASRPPGEWQSYDIIFHRPHFGEGGKLVSPARMTALHNGVLVQDNVELTGPTEHKERPPYKVHPEKLPLKLQDHGNPVRYRNIWIREL